MALYKIAILGRPSAAQLKTFGRLVKTTETRFKLRSGRDIEVVVNPLVFRPESNCASAAIFFGGRRSAEIDVTGTLNVATTPVLPVATRAGSVAKEIPASLAGLNCVFYKEDGPERVFSALLECLGLLPRQRRVFLSYRRSEATAVAIQLFAELSARHYEVFLDTHRIGAGVNFQESLWHNLCDVDVLVMLDTPTYFESRWTAAEFGRALAKGIGVLRVKWPDFDASRVSGTSSLVELKEAEFRSDGSVSDPALLRICHELEDFRSLAHATRHQSLVSAVQDAVVRVGGRVNGVDAHRAMQVTLRSGRQVVVQPVLGVPTSVTLHQALERAGSVESAIVFDHLGIMPSWLAHMDWLKTSVTGTRWIRTAEAAWDFGAWEV
jgi:hypothetical protein